MASPIIHSESCLIPGVVVAGDYLEVVGFAELLAVVELEFLVVFFGVVVGGLLDIDGSSSGG